MKVGIIGCGNISTSYLSRAPLFRGVDMIAVADLNPEAARARAGEFGLRALSVPEMLSDGEVELIVNLTIPAAHHTVTADILRAGKHAFSEKPLCLTLAEGEELRGLARAADVRIGCAPDTWLGGAHQLSRRLVDEGEAGRITHGTMHVMGAGMEMWHPNPDFFFQPGAGPVLDLGPYYIAQMVNLLGPVTQVAAMSNKGREERVITSQPRAGETLRVEVPTSVHALLRFGGGEIVTFGASWDVHGTRHPNAELYGTEAALILPDPNFFGGSIDILRHGAEPRRLAADDHPLAVPNRELDTAAPRADYRTVGLADMVDAIATGRDHRCSFERALHAVEVLQAILAAGETGAFIDITTTCTRPDPLDGEAARGLMRAG